MRLEAILRHWRRTGRRCSRALTRRHRPGHHLFEPLEPRQFLSTVTDSDGVPTQPIHWAMDPPPVPAATVIDFRQHVVAPYGGFENDVVGAAGTFSQGTGLHVAGNSWKRIDFPYRVTERTILEFDFRSEREGEVHGIGFDNDDTLSSDTFFKVHGTQSAPIVDFDTYQPAGWQHFQVHVGQYFTGDMVYLVFATDYDVPLPKADSYFANVTVYEEPDPGPDWGPEPPPPGDNPVVDFSAQPVIGYDPGQDVKPTVEVLFGGSTLYLAGNAWKAVSLPYTITEHTVLEFDFRSDHQGEVHGIGFDNDLLLTSETFFKVYGTQGAPIETFADYSPSAWKHYRIDVGEFFTGDMSFMVFAIDHDVKNPTGDSYFANVSVYEKFAPPPQPPPAPRQGLTPIDFTGQTATSYDPQQDGTGTLTPQYDGAAVEIAGNAWKKLALPYDVRANTVIEFDLRVDRRGEVLAVGLDSDSIASADRVFQLRGTETYGIQSYRTSLGTGWVHYRIEVGAHYGGHMEYLVLISDQDAGGAAAKAVLANVAIYDDPNLAVAPAYNSVSGYGLVDAARAFELATGIGFTGQPYYGGSRDWSLNAMGVPEVWSAGSTGQGIIVAVIDTGVNINHTDLDDNIWTNPREIPGNGLDDDGNGYADDVHGWNFVNNNNNVNDTAGHGTLVAGIIGAENNGVGATGVAPDARIMPVRVIDGFGGGSFDSVIKGFQYAVLNGARVINFSLAFETGHPDLQGVIQWAQSAGVVVVSAAGNGSNAQPVYPAAYASFVGLAVGAIDSAGRQAGFSNLAGPTVSDYVLAPGVNVYSTNKNGGYASVSATSWCAPQVAGIAALILSSQPSLPAFLVEYYIVQGANPVAVMA